MALPDHIRIGPAVYAVKLIDLKDDMGNCDAASLEIKIDTGMPDFRERTTLLHEILHGCSNEFNADVPGKHEEACVRAHESGLMSIAIDHPEILRYIFKL